LREKRGFKEQKTQLGQTYNLPRVNSNILGKLYAENYSHRLSLLRNILGMFKEGLGREER